jgi:3',5'-cyclic-AMP phosphodiesterase
MRGRVAQLTDTHIVREGSTYLGIDTSRYLADAIDAVHALDPLPEYIVVTGDMTNYGTEPQYARFREIMSRARLPYFVIPGNHDNRERLRATLSPQTYGGPGDELHFAIDDFPIRFVGLDCNTPRPWPGAVAGVQTLAWLERSLASMPERATIVAVHQPPFRTGLHYIDIGGFIGSTRLRSVIDRHANVRAVVSGHIHCVRSARWGSAVASSAASTSPQLVPLLFARGRVIGIARERAGFAVHDLHDDGSFARADFRRGDDGCYAPERDGSTRDTNRPS